MKRIRAVIFDMDGLLIASESMWRQAYRDVIPSFTDEQAHLIMGRRTKEVVQMLLPGSEDVSDQITDNVKKTIRKRGKLLPGARKALLYFQKKNIVIALASSSPLDVINTTLERLKIEDFFKTVVSACDEEKGKPDPAVYLTACRQLKMKPSQCLALEDSPAGIQSAKKAGLFCLSVPNDYISLEDVKEADIVLPSLDEIKKVEHIFVL